jgi:hypothetical protein
MNNHVLEPAAQEIADATSKPPFLYDAVWPIRQSLAREQEALCARLVLTAQLTG